MVQTMVWSIFTSSVVSLLWFWFIRNSSWSHYFQDVPNKRSSHTKIASRGAGYIFCLAIGFPIVFMGIQAGRGLAFKAFIIASAFVGLGSIGLIDDIYNVSAKLRLLFHLISAFLVVLIVTSAKSIVDWPILMAATTFIALTINFYNFADGINGFVATQFLITSAGWLSHFCLTGIGKDFFHNPEYVAPLVVCLTAFLWFNVVKKTVFMGDSGSTVLGLLVGSFHVLGPDFSFLSWIKSAALASIFSFVIFADCSTMIIAKTLLGINWTTPHRQHFYQRLSRRSGWSHIRASVALAILQFIINGVCLLVIQANQMSYWILFLVILIFLILFTFFTNKRSLKQAHCL